MLDQEKQGRQAPGPVIESPRESLKTSSPFFLKRLSQEVASGLGAIPLLACCFATGLTDGTLYNGEYKFC